MKDQCGYCQSSTGTTEQGFVYCETWNKQIRRDEVCIEYQREPGADDE